MLKSRSRKQAALERQRKPVALKVLAAHPWCQRCREALAQGWLRKR